MGNYSKSGSYAGYDKNHKERDKLDYYATPPNEVYNILENIRLSIQNSIILEPCAGEGYMVEGIEEYIRKNRITNIGIYATDVQKRQKQICVTRIQEGLEFDFLSDSYPYIKDIDYIIMNPPFGTIEPFAMKALEIAKKGVLMFGRLQFLESQGRYENIFKNSPPNDVYIYVDRVVCYKNGNFNLNTGSIQAYAWYYWDKESSYEEKLFPTLHWIRRFDKK